ncbi:threonine/serine exporter family protein [Schleiferilactobacillus harbinensis]
MTMEIQRQVANYMEQVMDACILAGRLMIANGSEMYRVEDTMRRIAQNAGLKEPVIFTTPTGIFVGLQDRPLTSLGTVTQRVLNIEKISRVNNLSREFAAGQIDFYQLYAALRDVDRATPTFPLWLQCIGAAVASALLMIIFAGQYDWLDMPLAAVSGTAGYLVAYYLGRFTKVYFITQTVAALACGIVAYLGVRLGLGHSIDNIILGGVMPLVPGVALTTSIRDLLAGDLLSGIARGIEAILSAIAIGVGIALIFRFLM